MTPFDRDFTIPTGLVTEWLAQLDLEELLGLTTDELASNWSKTSNPYPDDERIRDKASRMMEELIAFSAVHLNRNTIATILTIYAHAFWSVDIAKTRFTCIHCWLDPTCLCGINGVTYWFRNCRIDPSAVKIMESQYRIYSHELAARSALWAWYYIIKSTLNQKNRCKEVWRIKMFRNGVRTISGLWLGRFRR